MLRNIKVDMNFPIFLVITLLSSISLASCWPHFLLYTPENKDEYISIDAENITNSTFQYSRNTKFVIHGFGSSPEIDHLQAIKDGFLRKFNVNVIMIDWRAGSPVPKYLKAVQNARVTAQAVAEFILQTKLDPSTIHCVGHSLGAQACGFTSKIVRLPRISGLDPAGPLFRRNPPEDRLDKSDADYVDIIHTDILAGIQDSIGHKNFYPNGGKHQPGCLLKASEIELIAKIELNTLTESDMESETFVDALVIGCNHQRSTMYYAESINAHCKFSALKCPNYFFYILGLCKVDSPHARMGFYSYLDSASPEGRYYLRTTSKGPFCIDDVE